jgi:hypothetical protein
LSEKTLDEFEGKKIFVVCDEAHHILQDLMFASSESDATVSEKIRAVKWLTTKAQKMLFLTATPFVNKLTDAVHLVNIVAGKDVIEVDNPMKYTVKHSFLTRLRLGRIQPMVAAVLATASFLVIQISLVTFLGTSLTIDPDPDDDKSIRLKHNIQKNALLSLLGCLIGLFLSTLLYLEPRRYIDSFRDINLSVAMPDMIPYMDFLFVEGGGGGGLISGDEKEGGEGKGDGRH